MLQRFCFGYEITRLHGFWCDNHLEMYVNILV